MAQVVSHSGAYTQPHKYGEICLVSDTAVDNSDKTITVPTGKLWEIHNIYVNLVTDATVGNRLLMLVGTDGTTNVGRVVASAVQAASLDEAYHFAPQYNTATESPTGYHFCPLPARFLPAGCTLRIYDSAAVAAATDHLLVHIVVSEFDHRGA
jgi:hypothetical protein